MATENSKPIVLTNRNVWTCYHKSRKGFHTSLIIADDLKSAEAIGRAYCDIQVAADVIGRGHVFLRVEPGVVGGPWLLKSAEQEPVGAGTEK